MYCPSCGKETPENSTFCLHCGTRIDAPSTTPVAQALIRPAHFVLSPTSISHWRSQFGDFYDWGIGKPFSDKARNLLATLAPPLTPEDEALVFDTGINSGEYKVTEITYQGIALRDGFFFATESRLIFGNQNMGIGDKKGVVFQILYENIKAAYANNDNYTLILSNGVQTLVRTKIPRSSLLGAVAILGGSPADKATISHMERAKERGAQEFVAVFTRFFSEIADENRRRHGVETAVDPSIQKTEHTQPQVVSPSEASGVALGSTIVIQKPWYRSTGCLILSFLFATPIWSILILSNKDSRTWLKWVSGVFIAIWVIFLLISLSQLRVSTSQPRAFTLQPESTATPLPEPLTSDASSAQPVTTSYISEEDAQQIVLRREETDRPDEFWYGGLGDTISGVIVQERGAQGAISWGYGKQVEGSDFYPFIFSFVAWFADPETASSAIAPLADGLWQRKGVTSHAAITCDGLGEECTGFEIQREEEQVREIGYVWRVKNVVMSLEYSDTNQNFSEAQARAYVDKMQSHVNATAQVQAVSQTETAATTQAQADVTVTKVAPEAKTSEIIVEVKANSDWQNTGVYVQSGETVAIIYISGLWCPWVGFCLDGRGCVDVDPNVCSPDPNQSSNIFSFAHASLIGRIADGSPFAVGNNVIIQANQAGNIYLRINDRNVQDNAGAITVRLVVGNIQSQPAIKERVSVQANMKWQDTGILINQGENLAIHYVSGQWSIWLNVDPLTDGNGQTGRSETCQIMPQANLGSLIGRIGDNPPFFVGNGATIRSDYSGDLMLSINDCDNFQDNEGSLIVEMEIGQ